MPVFSPQAAAPRAEADTPAGSSAARRRRFRSRTPTLSAAAWHQFMQVARPYWTGDERRSAWSMLALLVLLMLFDTQLAVVLNERLGELTSALAARERGRFWEAVRTCLWVLAVAVPVYGFYYYMRDAFSNRWRRWLTGRFLDGYLDSRRYYTLQAEGDIDNPDQRISEDINTFTGRSANFLLIFLGSLIQLVAFSAVLWSISRPLVAFLVVYSIIGTVLALGVFGAPLIRLNFWQLRREADFRFGLMRLRENAESIAFYRGEAQERAQLDNRFEPVFNNYARLIKKQRSLNLFQRAFSQLTLVVPSVILADRVLSGELEVGVAVQAAGAFAAVLLAVSVIVDNFESLSRFVAGIGRLHALSERVLPALDHGTPADLSPGQLARLAQFAHLARPPDPLVAGTRRRPRPGPAAAAPAIPEPGAEALAEHIRHEPGDRLEVRDLTLYTPQFGRLLVSGLDLALPAGEGLLITGPSGCGKSSLLRALAGLWRTGSGVVRQLPPEQMFFLPQRPYLQHGSLRSQLVYPAQQADLDDDRLLEILREVRLEELAGRVGSLDAVHDWEKLLSMGEQQRLAFARVLVRSPKLVILDEATSALDSANEAALYGRLQGSGATLVSIAHRPAVLRYHARVLELQGGGAWTLHAAGDYRFEG